MRGDQLARQWRIIRGIGTSPNGLTVTEIAQREETGIRTIYRNLEALQAANFPYPCHAKPQSTPREIFRLPLSFLDIFLASSHPTRKAMNYPAASCEVSKQKKHLYRTEASFGVFNQIR